MSTRWPAVRGCTQCLVGRYVDLGLIDPREPTAVLRLRRITRLRGSLGINVAGVAVVVDLLDRIDALEKRMIACAPSTEGRASGSPDAPAFSKNTSPTPRNYGAIVM
jgi:hypothetical protein